ncbi:MAG: type II toxin-antitoxin system RelE/ParE family toxin [Egibacteraceae bacterium]
MKLLLRPAAVEDIRIARDYYADADPRLDEQLAQDLDRLFARLEAFPRSAPVVIRYEPLRRAVLRRFPFALFYQIIQPTRIDVLRIIHIARSPDTWPAQQPSA